ncbi:MAG: hypothetical protein Q8O13_07120 [Candidatus Omnitrophota bacterium]|nr:hypothetical protein [Candidatus Omnitrophota bacterium]
MHFKRKYLFVILSIFWGCILTIITTEILLHLIGPDWLKQRMKEVGVNNITGADPKSFGSDKGWPIVRDKEKFIKFVPFSHFHIRHYEYDVEASIDKWGGRRTAQSCNKHSGEIIPFLGDSFVFGVGVKDEETFVSLISQKLPYCFINLGTPGSSLPRQLDIIEQRHQELNTPSVYIFNFFIGNDFTNLFDKNVLINSKNKPTKLFPLRGKKSTQMLEAVNDFVRQNSLLRKCYLIQFIKAKLLVLYNDFLASRGVIKRTDDEIFHVIQDSRHFRKMQYILDEELRRLDKLAKELNFKAVFILIPDRHQVEKERLLLKLKYYGINRQNIDIRLPNRVMKEKLSNFNIPFIDLLECLEEKHRISPNVRLYYILDNHLTAKGHKAVADCIFYPLNSIISKYWK